MNQKLLIKLNIQQKVEVPRNGTGKFEYSNKTLYVGDWKLLDDGRKVKHGNGKIVFPGPVNDLGQYLGGEEYNGEWSNDHMHGYGTYKFTNGNLY